ncbi:GNAT family N-acetyltransferase [Promicromonospora sp. NPDC023805]|uniref:GNAT family N-acetyltransferase n=1 Tax=Promicromonospora sp. NPDC023805 TaxID=3154696 RepID=UPI0033D13D57
MKVDESVIIRPLLAGDLDKVVKLDEQAFGDDAWPRDWFEEIADHSDFKVYVAEIGRAETLTIAGYCALQVKDGYGEVATIGVGKSFRRAGLGRKMMSVLADTARTSGLSLIRLRLRTDNAHARKLYESLGFTTTGIERGYYESDGTDAEIMTIDL